MIIWCMNILTTYHMHLLWQGRIWYHRLRHMGGEMTLLNISSLNSLLLMTFIHKYPISELDTRFEWRANTTKIRHLFRLMWHSGREYICTCFVEYASSPFYHNGIAFDVLSGVNSRCVHRVLGVHRSFQLLLHFFLLHNLATDCWTYFLECKRNAKVKFIFCFNFR